MYTIERGALNLVSVCLNFGAHRAAELPIGSLILQPELRQLCEMNTCGRYGRNYTCPPVIGDIFALIGKIKSAKHAVLWQNVYQLEDSLDFEGMMSAQREHNGRAIAINDFLAETLKDRESYLVLGAGGCQLCDVCGMQKNQPCAHPEKALSSLEAYGINVTQACEVSGLRYLGGKNTVTYFAGAFLF